MEADVSLGSVTVLEGLKVPDVKWTCVRSIPVTMVAGVDKENANV